jgi:hypothetical protein
VAEGRQAPRGRDVWLLACHGGRQGWHGLRRQRRRPTRPDLEKNEEKFRKESNEMGTKKVGIYRPFAIVVGLRLYFFRTERVHMTSHP